MNKTLTEDDDALLRLLRGELFQFNLTRLELVMKAAGALTLDWKSDVPPVRGTASAYLDGRLELKAADEEQGVLTGYLSTYGLDLGGDEVQPGAYAKTLGLAHAVAARHMTKALYPFLWQHDKADPIGAVIHAHEDKLGLLVTLKLNTGIEHGRQAYHGLAHGYMGMSIGYRPVLTEWQGGIRLLKEIHLVEGSAVTFPMNTDARVYPRSLPGANS